MPIDADRVLRNLGRRLAELRVESGLTQEALAEQIGVSGRYVQQVEAGRNMNLRTLITWANVFDVTLATLLEAPRTPKPPPGRPKRRS